MTDKIRVRCDRYEEGVKVTTLEGGTIPPGYGLKIQIDVGKHPIGSTWTEEADITPAPGLHAKYLRWRYPSE